MNIIEKFRNRKKDTVEENKKLIISNDDKIKLLSALYTYNHGDKVCMPGEYSFTPETKENGCGDYKLLQQEIEQLGYKIKEVVFANTHYKLAADAEAFEERKKTSQFFPRDVAHFVLSNKDEECFTLVETPETLDFLAKSGDERAIGTYNNWISKVKDLQYEYPAPSTKK